MKNVIKNVVLCVLFLIGVLLIVAGCMPFQENIWPANAPVSTKAYVKAVDPCAAAEIKYGKNFLGYESIAGTQQWALAMARAHAKKQNELVAELNTDSALYALAKNDSVNQIKASLDEMNKWTGENGILFGVGGLLTGGVVGGLGIRKIMQNVLYTKQEVDAEKQIVQVETTAKLQKEWWNSLEVSQEVGERVRSALVKAGVMKTMPINEIEQIIADERKIAVSEV